MLENLRTLPINSLKVFEAAARLGNFAQAAVELHVTPAAVSQQIKKLEEWCGTQLFQRIGRTVQLTQAGYHLLPGVTDGLARLDEAVGRVARHPGANRISISTVGAFAARWLVPRLDRWRMAHPNINIMVSTSGQLVDFNRDQIDVAIRIGDGNYPGLHSDLLMRETVVPLCHPKLLNGDPPLKKPRDLNHHPLIHFTPMVGDIKLSWRDWLDAVGVEGVDSTRGLFFNDFVVALNATIAGQGVLLALHTLVADDLKAGVLVVPFGGEGYQSLGWHMVMPKSRMKSPNAAMFRDWLITEARSTDSSRPTD
jgi:LysR family glycine cleavage system transcriptional activator